MNINNSVNNQFSLKSKKSHIDRKISKIAIWQCLYLKTNQFTKSVKTLFLNDK